MNCLITLKDSVRNEDEIITYLSYMEAMVSCLEELQIPVPVAGLPQKKLSSCLFLGFLRDTPTIKFRYRLILGVNHKLKTFSIKSNMLTHKKTKHSIYQCEICDECFSKKSDLTKYFNSRHLQCPHCNLNMKSRFTRNRHINSKHKQIIYPCDECKSTFNRADHL